MYYLCIQLNIVVTFVIFVALCYVYLLGRISSLHFDISCIMFYLFIWLNLLGTFRHSLQYVLFIYV